MTLSLSFVITNSSTRIGTTASDLLAAKPLAQLSRLQFSKKVPDLCSHFLGYLMLRAVLL